MDKKSISDTTGKKSFPRGKLREDIFGDLTFFTKYQVVLVTNDQTMLPTEDTMMRSLDWVEFLSIATYSPMSIQNAVMTTTGVL